MNNAAYNNTNNNTHNHTDNHTMLHWFYSFNAKVRLTGTAQRLWHCLYYRMDGTAAGTAHHRYGHKTGHYGAQPAQPLGRVLPAAGKHTGVQKSRAKKTGPQTQQ